MSNPHRIRFRAKRRKARNRRRRTWHIVKWLLPTDKETMAMLPEEDREALRHREIDTTQLDASIAQDVQALLDAKEPPPGWSRIYDSGLGGPLRGP